jgi:DNA-binding beta-propeller fold protein YncE
MQHSHDKTNSHCPACDYGPFTRNNYFTGKLLVERDFTDEQRYYVDKLRHHNQRLHGWGVVCGLKVKQHANESCRNRFVCIEPGTAIDCCGHEIIVREEYCFDFAQTELIKNLRHDKDTNAHRLQICLRYRECPTEKIPVLYDECGCDDSACAPNRILESFELDLKLAEDDAAVFHTPELNWRSTSNPPHAFRAALHSDSHRLYVITGDTNHTVFQIDTENYSVVGSHALTAKGLALAVSHDGSRLYVITEADTDPDNQARQLLVLDTANHLANEQRKFEVAGSEQSDVFLTVGSDQRLLAQLGKSGTVLIWPTTLDDAGGALAPSTTSLSLGSDLRGLVVDSEMKRAFAADKANGIQVLDIAGNTRTTINVPNPSALALVTGSTEMLAVISEADKKLHLIGLNPDQVLASTPLPHAPIDLVVSPGGGWAYVLQQDGSDNYVQPISLDRLQQNLPPFVGAPLKVGNHSSQIVISSTGSQIYIPFIDDLNLLNRGGVAVIEVNEETCAEILWRDLEGCAHCDNPNCVVLATIEGYQLDDQIWDQADPPADPALDDNNHIDRIDNLTRRLLPSTQVLTDVVKCLLEHKAEGGKGEKGDKGDKGDPGEKGAQGAQGDKGNDGTNGTDGLGIDDVKVDQIPCDQAPAPAKITIANGKRTLEFEVQRGCDAVSPQAPELAHICAINWPHTGNVKGSQASEIDKNGLLIAFDRPVLAQDINPHSLVVLVSHVDDATGSTCWCELQGTVSAGKVPLCSTENFQPVPVRGKASEVNGAQFRPKRPFQTAEYRVLLKGDFIRDQKTQTGVDADHVPPWFSSAAPYFTGDGVQGGTFESWFTFTRITPV